MAERWLVIDDSSTIQRVIKLAFQGYDVLITEADNCQEAVREIMAHPPSLVIADAALGGTQGVQDFIALKSRAPDAPFIILEGSYDNIDEAEFRAAGFDFFLKKPFDGAQLLAMTREALGRALPYRGEAAIAAAAGASAPQGPGNNNRPPPPPPVRQPVADLNIGFAADSGAPGFDLGLQERRSGFGDTRHAPSLNPVAPMPGESKTIAQTIAAEVRNMAQAQTHQPVQPIAFARKEGSFEPVRSPTPFSLDDDDEPLAPPVAPAPTPNRELQRQAEQERSGWEGPRPAGSHLGNLLEPMLQEEMEKLVRVAVEDYCRKHFAGIAREMIQRELERLTQDRSRLLMD